MVKDMSAVLLVSPVAGSGAEAYFMPQADRITVKVSVLTASGQHRVWLKNVADARRFYRGLIRSGWQVC